LLELETQLSIARDLEYLDSPTFKNTLDKAEEVGRILNGLLNHHLQTHPDKAA